MPASLLKFVRLPDFEHPLAWLALVAVALWTATSTEPVTLTVLYGVLFATGWRATAQGSLRKPGLADAAMLVFALVLALRTATSAMPSQALLLGAGYLLYPAAYLVGRLTRTPEPRALLQGFIVPVLLVLVAWVAHDVATQVNVYGPFADSNSLAALMAGLTVTGASLAFGAARRRLTGTLLLAAAAPALYCTESRGVIVALGALGAAFALASVARRWPQWGRAQRVRASLAGALASGLLVAGATAYVGEKLANPDISTQARVALLKTAVDIGLEKGPWFGGGLATFAHEYPARRPLADQESAGLRAHNDYVELFADGGLVLSTALLLVSAAVLRAALLAWYRRDAMRGALLAAGTYFALHAALNHLYVNPSVALIAGLLTAWGMPPLHRDSSARASLARVLLCTGVAAIVPALGYFALAEAHVRAALRPGSAFGLSAPFRTEAGLRYFAEAGWTPRAAFVYGLKAEMALNQLAPGAPGRATLAREALRRYVTAFNQYPSTGYAYQIARLLQYTPEFAANAALAREIPVWYATAIRLDRVNMLAFLGYARWLAAEHRASDAIAVLDDALTRVWRPSIRQPLLNEQARIREAIQPSGGV